jgi:hypothetical protein
MMILRENYFVILNMSMRARIDECRRVFSLVHNILSKDNIECLSVVTQLNGKYVKCLSMVSQLPASLPVSLQAGKIDEVNKEVS